MSSTPQSRLYIKAARRLRSLEIEEVVAGEEPGKPLRQKQWANFPQVFPFPGHLLLLLGE